MQFGSNGSVDNFVCGGPVVHADIFLVNKARNFRTKLPFATCFSHSAGAGALTIVSFHMQIFTDLNEYIFTFRPKNPVIV